MCTVHGARGGRAGAPLTHSSAKEARRLATTTRAPFSARALAASTPIPDVPPVTSATRPARRGMVAVLHAAPATIVPPRPAPPRRVTHRQRPARPGRAPAAGVAAFQVPGARAGGRGGVCVCGGGGNGGRGGSGGGRGLWARGGGVTSPRLFIGPGRGGAGGPGQPLSSRWKGVDSLSPPPPADKREREGEREKYYTILR